MSPEAILARLYQKAQSATADLNPEQDARLRCIAGSAEQHKAILAALLTSLVKKVESPSQDVRLHKTEFSGGYSGRVYDTRHITPFIRARFPRLAMKSGSGWLTRSIEQAHPFTLDFPGRIAQQDVKEAFLRILDDIEQHPELAEAYACQLLRLLLAQQDQDRALANAPVFTPDLTIRAALDRVNRHFSHDYQASGASLLPVLAIYSILELLMGQQRYQNKRLQPLKSHTTSDEKSGSLGDIEIVDADGQFFEAFEIKHKIPISAALLSDVAEKIRGHKIRRYLLLTTHEPNTHEAEALEALALEIRAAHGCEIIVNGVIPTLKYTLRLIERPELFLERYSRVLIDSFERGTDIKRVHLQAWQAINA